MNKEPKVFNEYDLLRKEDGLIYNKDGFLFTGTYCGPSGRGFPSGTLKVEYKNGEQRGLQEHYYKNGQLESSAYYKGDDVGTEEHYFDNGQLESKYIWEEEGCGILLESYNKSGRALIKRPRRINH